MTQKDIRVGIVGANAKAGWAKVSHAPAINGLPGLKLAAAAARIIEANWSLRLPSFPGDWRYLMR